MASNKERIENLEVSLGGLQDSFSRMELGMADKLRIIEENLKPLTDAIASSLEGSNSNASGRASYGRSSRGEGAERIEGGRQTFCSKLAKLEFPCYSGNDPTEWFNRVEQFFEHQHTTTDQKVALESYHLEGETNQWWQWLRRVCKEEEKEITWAVFEEELWLRFRPTENEDFDEALSKIKQKDSLREYQKEFERLGNRVQGWTQRALVGTFIGGLKFEIADEIRMFRPKSLKEVIRLARIREDQLNRQRWSNQSGRGTIAQPYQALPTPSSLPTTLPTAVAKRISWDEMQKRRTQGLYFNCDERFTPGHRCRKPQLLLLEGDKDETTWANNILNLEDKVPKKGGGNDKV